MQDKVRFKIQDTDVTVELEEKGVSLSLLEPVFLDEPNSAAIYLTPHEAVRLAHVLITYAEKV